jgi:very-short-patch-repair endonuclease
MTRQEVKLWTRLRLLRNVGFHFRRQVPIGDAVVDFACLKQRLIIEVDGGQHGLDGHVERDRARDQRLEPRGSRVFRIWNCEIDRNLSGALDPIWERLKAEEVPTPSASRRTLPFGEG